MNVVRRAFIIVLSLMVFSSCSAPNLLTEYSQTDTDEALFFEAKKKIDNLEWDAAIDLIENQISDGFASQVEVQEALAGAYAGKCGFTFIDVINGLINSPSSNIFPYFMGIFAGTTLQPASCDESIRIITSLGSVLERSQDQNLFLTVLGIARIGTTLGAKLDLTSDGVPDGVYGTDFNVCHNYSGATATDGYPGDIPIAPPPKPTRFLTDEEVKKVASGIGLVFENMSALAAALSGDNSTLTALQAALTTCESIPGVTDCRVTDETAVSAGTLFSMRYLLDTATMGFGSCDPTKGYPDPSACCPALKPPGI